MHSQYEHWRVDYKFDLSALMKSLKHSMHGSCYLADHQANLSPTKFGAVVPAKLSPAQ